MNIKNINVPDHAPNTKKIRKRKISLLMIDLVTITPPRTTTTAQSMITKNNFPLDCLNYLKKIYPLKSLKIKPCQSKKTN